MNFVAFGVSPKMPSNSKFASFLTHLFHGFDVWVNIFQKLSIMLQTSDFVIQISKIFFRFTDLVFFCHQHKENIKNLFCFYYTIIWIMMNETPEQKNFLPSFRNSRHQYTVIDLVIDDFPFVHSVKLICANELWKRNFNFKSTDCMRYHALCGTDHSRP